MNGFVKTFPGGFYQRKENIFGQLKEFNCVVPANDSEYEWFTVFYFEAISRPEEITPTPLDRKLQWQAQYVAISVSICSNVEHFTEPMCFVDEDPDQLIQLLMVTYMEEIAEDCKSLAQNKWGGVIQEFKTAT